MNEQTKNILLKIFGRPENAFFDFLFIIAGCLFLYFAIFQPEIHNAVYGPG